MENKILKHQSCEQIFLDWKRDRTHTHTHTENLKRNGFASAVCPSVTCELSLYSGSRRSPVGVLWHVAAGGGLCPGRVRSEETGVTRFSHQHCTMHLSEEGGACRRPVPDFIRKSILLFLVLLAPLSETLQ